MGCDYYINIHLFICYKNDRNKTRIPLSQERGYFYDINMDSDEEDYEEKMAESVAKQLEPRMKPIIIYENSVFCKPIFEDKYKDLIIHHLPDDKTWADIAKIVKKESRYERD
jgi:predicted ABC-type ATPase